MGGRKLHDSEAVEIPFGAGCVQQHVEGIQPGRFDTYYSKVSGEPHEPAKPVNFRRIALLTKQVLKVGGGPKNA